jgi:hypothetical protein
MTVAVQPNHHYTLSVVGGVKQLNRRRLPIQSRLANNLKRKHSLSTKAKSSHEEIILTPSRRLNTLKQSYARRGVQSVSPPRPVIGNLDNSKPPNKSEVSVVSLAGAKRSYIQLDVPPYDDYDSDSSESCASLSSSSTIDANYNRFMKSSKRRMRFVQFATRCAVVEIPHRCAYSTKQKAAMWNGSKKIRIMAKRNAIEFQHDGWNIETASEEHEFVIVDGKSVHPVYSQTTQL